MNQCVIRPGGVAGAEAPQRLNITLGSILLAYLLWWPVKWLLLRGDGGCDDDAGACSRQTCGCAGEAERPPHRGMFRSHKHPRRLSGSPWSPLRFRVEAVLAVFEQVW